MRDNRPLEARADVLTFTRRRCSADLDALGPVHADIRLRSSRADTDVFVRVCDVQPDGASLNVCDALVRLTPASPRATTTASPPCASSCGRPRTASRAGHRIRVQVSSGAHPRYARNPGTGEDPLRATDWSPPTRRSSTTRGSPSSVTLTVA